MVDFDGSGSLFLSSDMGGGAPSRELQHQTHFGRLATAPLTELARTVGGEERSSSGVGGGVDDTGDGLPGDVAV